MGLLRITVLGSGTSVGVPTVGCGCPVCRSDDPRDKRLRPSVLLRYAERCVLIDTTPDFRLQALRAGLERLDAILFTHAHADHIMGLDDVRPFNFRQKGSIPAYGSEETIAAIRRRFDYIFDAGERESQVPRLELRPLDGSPFELFGRQFTPVPVLHGRSTVYGFRFGRAAYLTDHSEIPEESLEKLYGLEVLFLDALRRRPHPTHSTLERSLGYVERLRPARAYFTHICHDLPHEATQRELPPGVYLAYDGLEIAVEEE
ncbi:MAG TPA: MBL fold metallo-hydrolase [Bryobacteraceae bacterium]|nr:MBL fold metallo-hydrolase [Bryobacteraceae bacterium]